MGARTNQIIIGSKEQFIFALTTKGQVYLWGDFSVSVPIEDSKSNQSSTDLPKPVKVLNNLANTHLSYEGTLYCWGDDSENRFGVLGLGAQYKAQRPCPNSQLFDYMIKNVSVAETHSCAVDSSGRLFCWGYGPNGELGLENQLQQVNVPTVVTKQKTMNIKKAIAHNTYTAFCSGAGYVFIYGALQTSMNRFQQNNSQDKFSVRTRTQQSMERGVKESLQRGTQPSNVSNKPMNDDALESVQINEIPVSSVALAGSKIYGLALEENKLLEWSTSGLNKLSFNKENKMLLRQDFQLKQYQLDEKFAQESQLQNLGLIKNMFLLNFKSDPENLKEFQMQEGSEFDFQNPNIKIGHLIQQNQGPQYGSLQESLYSEHEKEIKKNEVENKFIGDSPQTALLDIEERKQINKPQQLIRGKHDHLPSFRAVDQQLENQFSNPCLYVDDETKKSLLQFQTENITQRPQNQQTEEDLAAYSLLQGQILKYGEDSSEDETPTIQKDQRPIDENIKQFYIDTLQINTESMIMNQDQPCFAYRPSSIKSYHNSAEKSKSYMLFNNNSSPSMKECTEQMRNQFGTCNNNDNSPKIELSYPSFLNNSQDNQQNQLLIEELQNPDIGEDICQEDLQHCQEGEIYLQTELDQNQKIEEPNEEFCQSGISRVNVENLDSTFTPVQVSIQQPFFERYLSDQTERLPTQDHERVELKFRFGPRSNNAESINLSLSKNSSREASIIRTTRNVEDGTEESMEITIDNLQIQTKRTTTPKRILNNFIQNRRIQKSSQSSNQVESHSFVSQKKQDQSSMGSKKSELSDDFNLTQNSGSQVDRNSQPNLRGFILKEDSIINFDQSNLKFKQRQMMQMMNRPEGSQQDKMNTSLNSNLLEQGLYPLQMDQKATSVTQIYEISPLKENPIQSQQPFKDQQVNSIKEQNRVSSQTQSLSQSQIQYAQQRYSNLIQPIPKVVNEGFHRDSLGRITHQSEDNFEIEYTISQSQTPESQNIQLPAQPEQNIKRRINFDETSCFDNCGGVIRVSDIDSVTNKLISSFSVSFPARVSNINQDSIKHQDTKFTQDKNNLCSNADQSQSLIFNQSTNSMPIIQPFNDENIVSNIKSATTPSNNGNTTQFMMLTEEKFKNLKGEISQQADYTSVINAQPFNLQFTNPSPRVIDFTSTVKPDSHTSFRPSNVHNMASFIQHSKYFQVYENYRRGFGIIATINQNFKSIAFSNLKANLQQKKQKSALAIKFSKSIFRILRQNVSEKKGFAFKKLKKQLKEKQLRYFIELKQKQFAQQAQGIMRIDSIYVSQKLKVVGDAFKGIYLAAQMKKQAKQLQQSLSLKKIYSILNNVETILKKNLLQRWLLKTRYIKQQSKLSAILTRQLSRERSCCLTLGFSSLKANKIEIQRKDLLEKIQTKIHFVSLKNGFDLMVTNAQRKRKEEDRLNQCKYAILEIIQKRTNLLQKQYFLRWHQRARVNQKVLIAIQMMSHIYEQQQKLLCFRQYQKAVASSQIRQQYLKSLKASTLLLIKKVDEIRKNNLKVGFQQIKEMQLIFDDTMLVKQSQGAMTNLSFNQTNPHEISLVLNKRQAASKPNLNNTAQYREENGHYNPGNLTQRNHYKTQQQQRSVKHGSLKNNKSSGKSSNQKDQRVALQNISAFIDQKRPTLNDYLSFTPNTDSNQKQGQHYQSKFFNHKRNGAAFSNEKSLSKNFAATQVIKNSERQYLDCPLPLKDYQERVMKKNQSKQELLRTMNQVSKQSQHSQENLNQMNLSIKDMNKAFRDQISRMKEKEEANDKSFNSSYQQNYNGQDQSFDQRINQLYIEITQTPEQLDHDNSKIYQKKLQFENRSKNISPKINPLCASESYQVYAGLRAKQLSGVQFQSIENQNQNFLSNYASSLRDQNFMTDQSQKQISNNIILSDKINEHAIIPQNIIPKTSTFGEIKGEYNESCDSNLEDIEDANQEQKFQVIHHTESRSSNLMQDNQIQFSNLAYQHQMAQQIGKRRSDQRYQANSIIEQDFSIEMDQDLQQVQFQNQDFKYMESEQDIINMQTGQNMNRVKSANNITQQFVKNSMADLAKKRLERQQNPQMKLHETNFFQSYAQVKPTIITPEYIDVKKVMPFPLKTFDNRKQQNDDDSSAKSQSSSSNPVKFAFQLYQELQNQNKIYQELRSQTSMTKNLHISPKFTNIDESFVPSQLNRELLNEMAANFQMLELTPDCDYQMLLNNKSVFQRQESSIYSNNLYAEPIEMALSPRNNNVEVSIINPQNLSTNQSQINCQDYGLESEEPQLDYQTNNDDHDQILLHEYQTVPQDFTQWNEQRDQERNFQDDECDYYQVLNGQVSRPYDFELSSHSKYKIISENDQARQILTTESAQPSSIMLPQQQNLNNICKKLSFGYDMSKRNNEKAKIKKSTLIVSGGEQTINFNLTQEDEENQYEQSEKREYQKQQARNNGGSHEQCFSDDDLDDNDENTAEQVQHIYKAIPESRILQQELQNEKFNMTQGSIEGLNNLRQNNMDEIGYYNGQLNYPQTQREYQAQSKRGQFNTQGFIQNNIQKLREILKASPRYNHDNFDQNYFDDRTQRISTAQPSTKNATAVNKMLFTQRDHHQNMTADFTNDQQYNHQNRMFLTENQNIIQNKDSRSFVNQYQQSYDQQNQFLTHQSYQQSFQRTQRVVEPIIHKVESSQQLNKFKYLTNSRANSKENQNSKNKVLTTCTTQNSKGQMREALETRKQSIPPTQNNIPQPLSHQSSQQSLNTNNFSKRASSSRKIQNNAGVYQPITFRAQQQNDSQKQSSNSSSNNNWNQYAQVQQQSDSQTTSCYNSLQNNTNKSQSSEIANSKLNATGGSYKDISLNNSNLQAGSKLYSTGNSHKGSGIGMGLSYLQQVQSQNTISNGNPSEFKMFDKRVSQQEERSVNLSIGLHTVSSNKQNKSGLGNTTQRESNGSQSTRSRNNQPERVSSYQRANNQVFQNLTNRRNNQ